MLRESVRDFALAKLRPAAQAADDACATPPELLAQSGELGLTMVGVPEELGGAVAERSAVTSVLMGEALALGDMGIAVACLAPAGGVDRAQPVGRRRPAGHLPARVRRRERPGGGAGDVRAACPVRSVRAPDPRPARRRRLQPRRRQVAGARRSRRRAVHRRGRAGGRGSRAVHRRAGRAGSAIEPEPAMGIRAAATGRLLLEDVKLPGAALLGDSALVSPNAFSSGGSAGARWPSAPDRPCSTT